MRKFVCTRQGFREDKHMKKKATRKRKARDMSRCGCLAKLEIARNKETGQWYVKDFIDEHNHALVSQDLSCLLRSHRRISAE
jgi:zinc finger SWIM domain-containing protein 3